MSASPRSFLLFVTTLSCTLLTSGLAQAAEGMYLLDKLPVERLKKSGLKIPPAELTRLSRAVVQVARGGTGSFVSPDGLLVTNHHVAYGCLARLGARKEHLGLLDKGYLAKQRTDELNCPGYDLLAVREVRDVTAEVLKVLKPRMHWSKRFEAIRLRKADLVKACEKGGKQICEVAAMDGGNSYLLSVYDRIRDVRLVYAPPKALGKYGGDVDNWIFPRHTADFTFLRAYVDKQGQGATFAAGNVPMKTPVHLKVSPHGVRRGSLALVVGFPGRTSRHVTSHAARFYVEQQVPGALKLLQGLVGVVHGRQKASADAKRKYAGLEAGLQNALKYYGMSLKGFKKWRVLERKLEQEQALAQELKGDRKRGAQYRKLLGQIGGVYGKYRKVFPRYVAAQRLIRVAGSLRVAYTIVKWGKEKAKPERMRKEQTYKDKNIYRLQGAAKRLDLEVEAETEKALLLYVLRELEQLPAGQRLKSTAKLLRWEAAKVKEARRIKLWDQHFKKTWGVAWSKDRLENAVNMLYGGTRLLARSAGPKELDRAAKVRAELLAAKPAAIKRDKDPLLRFARDLEAELHALKEGPFKEVEQRLKTKLHPQWVKEVKKPSYPDANFTARLTLGSVRDYTASATGRKHRYITSLSGLIKKDKGKFPFLVPANVKAAFPGRMKSAQVDRQIKDIPANFTTTLDTTGGNSGSPVLDDKGRLVGLLFDGTPESILSDWQYLPDEQRSICMDIRLALYLAGVEGATRVLQELGARR
jgi:Peptidase S46